MEQVQNAGGAVREPATQPSGTTGKASFWRRPAVILGGAALLAVAAFFGMRYLVETFTHESTPPSTLT